MSLDGFIAGPNGAMDWVFESPVAPDGPNESDEEVIRSTGAVLVGRRCYEVGKRAARPETSGLFGGRWIGPEFVLTHVPPEGEPSPMTRFLAGDIRQAVSTALAAGNGKHLLVLGANVVGQWLDEGLVDEIRLHLAPVLLGDGVNLFGTPSRLRVELELVSATRTGHLTDLHFMVTK
jgi:dihydrofolate reductase